MYNVILLQKHSSFLIFNAVIKQIAPYLITEHTIKYQQKCYNIYILILGSYLLSVPSQVCFNLLSNYLIPTMSI